MGKKEREGDRRGRRGEGGAASKLSNVNHALQKVACLTQSRLWPRSQRDRRRPAHSHSSINHLSIDPFSIHPWIPSPGSSLCHCEPWLTAAPAVLVHTNAGETEEQYLRTEALVREVGFDRVNTAAYSPRPNTPAAEWDNQVADLIKADRLNRLYKDGLIKALSSRLGLNKEGTDSKRPH
eukprot:1161568-Pelagomonas_calceolata.AAC.15